MRRFPLAVALLAVACRGAPGSPVDDEASQEDDTGGTDDDDGGGDDDDDGHDGSADGGSGNDDGTGGDPDTAGDTDTETGSDLCTNGVLDPGEEAIDCGGDCPTCPGVAFDADPILWSVPSSRFFGTTDTFNLQWTTLDLDGDGRPDLVETHEGYAPFGGKADPHWRVYANAGGAFGSDAAWSLPSMRFFGTSDSFNLQWTTVDLDGDGRPDLVETHENYAPFGGEADPRWRLFSNAGDGFAASDPWSLPSSRFFGTSDTFNLQWTMLDIDGDDLPDLVETHEGYAPFGDDAEPHWRVYANTADGFGASAPWPLPSPRFFGTSDTFNLQWTTLDLDGDGLPDLVETHEGYAPFGGEADPHWVIYPNTGDGFGDAQAWSLPSSRFFGTTDTFNLQWTTLDIDGDGRPDLVETHEGYAPFGGEADPHWRVYRNGGDGFESSTQWSLPSARFFGTTDTFNLQWTTLDIDGDGRPDLVETHEGYAPFGGEDDPHWRVYRNIPAAD